MTSKSVPIEARWWAKVDTSGPAVLDTPCWLWTGAMYRRTGYGSAYDGAHTRGAHRVGYQLLVGPIPPDLQLDHLCRVRRCVNPSHLEPVTNQENRRRYTVLITHCPKGHVYDEANTDVRKGKRNCRICDRLRRRLGKRRARLAYLQALDAAQAAHASESLQNGSPDVSTPKPDHSAIQPDTRAEGPQEAI